MRYGFPKFSGCLIFIVSALFSALLAPGISFAQKDSIPSKPELVIAEPVHGFGAVSQGTIVQHDFVLKNSGDADLNLQRIVPACGCTATSTSKNVIKPGEEAVVKAEFDTTGFSGDKVKVIRIYTNDPDHHSTVLTLKGRIEADVQVKPVRVNFGKVYQGATGELMTKSIEVRARKGSDIKLGEVSSRSKHLELEMEESSTTYKKFKIQLLPDAPTSDLRDRIVVKVSGSRQKSIHIPVFASVKGPIEISPTALSFGVLEGDKPITRSLRLENKSSKPLKILSLDSGHPAVSATQKEIQGGKIYVLKVTVDPEKVTKDLRSLIEVKTNNNDQEILRVSVYGILPPKI